MSFGKRFKILREFRELTQMEIAIELGIKPLTYIKIEQDKNKTITFEDIETIMNHEQYGKYWLWLTTGKTLPDYGQISPEIEEQKTA